MEDADSDSGFDSDGDWYHAGRDIVHGLRTNSHAVGPDGAHRRRFLCEEEKKGGTRRWDASLYLALSNRGYLNCHQSRRMSPLALSKHK